MTLARSIFLSIAFLSQLQGSRLGSPKNEVNVDGWAWKESDGQHSPKWAGKAKTVEKAPEPVGAGMARKALHENGEKFESDKKVMAGYDSNSGVHKKTSSDLGSDSSASGSADLQTTLENDCEGSITLAQFMPKCLKHTKSLIADLDYNYGDAQLETILRNWCQSAKEFPNARGTRKVIGFRNHQSCTDFADDLKNARYYELSHQSEKGYKDFCTAFYDHHGGFAAPAPPKKQEAPKYSSASLAQLSMVVASLVCTLAA